MKISPRASKAARTPVGESARVPDHARYFLELRARPGKVAIHFDVELSRLARSCVSTKMNIAGLLVDDRVGTRRRIHDIEVVVLRELRELFVVEAVGEQIDCVIAVREEVDSIADPHRVVCRCCCSTEAFRLSSPPS